MVYGICNRNAGKHQILHDFRLHTVLQIRSHRISNPQKSWKNPNKINQKHRAHSAPLFTWSILLFPFFFSDKVPNFSFMNCLSSVPNGGVRRTNKQSAVRLKYFMHHEHTLELDRRNRATCTLLISTLH